MPLSSNETIAKLAVAIHYAQTYARDATSDRSDDALYLAVLAKLGLIDLAAGPPPPVD